MDARVRHYTETAQTVRTEPSIARRQRDRWLRSILEIGSTATIVVDTAGRVLCANTRAAAALGYDAGALALLAVDDVLSTLDGAAIDSGRLAELASSAPPAALTLAARCRDGRVLRVETTVAVLDGDERPLYAVAMLDVTRRTESEREREMLLQLLEQSTDFVALADLQGRLLWMNAAARRMVGHDDDYRGREIVEYVAPRCRDFLVNVFLPRVRERGVAHADLTLVNLKTGEEIEVHRSIFLVRDPASGETVGIGTVTRDVREQQAARREMEAERIRLQLALDAGGMGSWEWDLQTNRARWNEREFQLAGLTPTPDGVVDARAFFDRIVAEDRPGIEASIANTLGVGEEFRHEFRIVDPVRGLRWLAGHGRLVPDGAGGVRMIGLNWDVTESRAREEELRALNERARTTLELLSRAERAARVGAFVDRLDRPDGLVWSETMHEILGLPKTERPDRRTAFDMFAPALKTVLQHAVAGAKRDGTPVEIEVPLLPRAGRAAWVRVYIVPHVEGGTCVQISGAVQDISARKRLELEVVTAANTERERIGADLHDDLGQILTGLSLQLHAHARDVGGTAKLAQQAELLEATLQRAREACRRLARAYVAPVAVECFEQMLLQLAADVPDAIRCLVCVERPLPPTTPVAVAQELYRIAQEAVNNAIRHARCATVRITVGVTRDRLELTVVDDGIGTSGGGRPGGVGLTTMRSRAARIGGLFALEPAPEGGTCVRVTVARLD